MLLAMLNFVGMKTYHTFAVLIFCLTLKTYNYVKGKSS